MSNRSLHIPYARFRAALDARDLDFVRKHAGALEPIGLAEALEICLLIHDQNPPSFERAAVRWIGRFALETRSVGIDDVKFAAGALGILPDQPEHAMEILTGLCTHHGIVC